MTERFSAETVRNSRKYIKAYVGSLGITARGLELLGEGLVKAADLATTGLDVAAEKVLDAKDSLEQYRNEAEGRFNEVAVAAGVDLLGHKERTEQDVTAPEAMSKSDLIDELIKAYNLVPESKPQLGLLTHEQLANAVHVARKNGL